MDIEQTIRNVIMTIGQVKTTNENDNWNKLLGCQMALGNVLKALQEAREAKEGADSHEGPEE
jgi:hypothetical protein